MAAGYGASSTDPEAVVGRDRPSRGLVAGVGVMVVGAVLVAVALVSHSNRHDRVQTATTQHGVTITGVPSSVTVVAASTAPTLAAGLGHGVAPAHRGRRALRGFSEATATITSGSGETCEVCLLAATTGAQQERGLMQVTDPTLGGYDGMVFVYGSPVGGAFWMRNTPMPLSIAYFDARGRLVSTAAMAPCADSPTCRAYPAGAPFAFALEVPQGKLATFKVTGRATIVVRVQDCPFAAGHRPPSTKAAGS